MSESTEKKKSTFKPQLYLSFIAYFVIVLLLSVVTVLYTARYITRQANENYDTLNLRLLQNTADTIDQEFYNLYLLMSASVDNPYIFQRAILPDTKVQASDSITIAMLEKMRGEDPRLKEILVYVPRAEKVYSSTEGCLTLNGFSRVGLLNSFLRDGLSIEYDHEGKRLFLSQYEGDIYLCNRFPLSDENRTLAMLIYRMKGDWFSAISKEVGQGKIYVLSPEGKALSGTTEAYREKAKALFSHVGQPDVYSVSCKDSGIQLLMPKQVVSYQAVFKNRSAASILLFLPLFSFLLTAFSGLWFTRRLFIPLGNLIRNIHRSRKSHVNQEIRHLKDLNALNTYLDASFKEKEESEKLLQNIKPEVTYVFFHNLLMGKWMDTESITSTLSSIGSPLDADGRYFVGLLTVAEGSDDISRRELLRSRALSHLASLSESMQFRYHIHQASGSPQTIIIIERDRSFGRSSNNMFVIQLLQELNHITPDMIFNIGNCSQSMQELHLSYRSAINYYAEKKKKLEATPYEIKDDRLIEFSRNLDRCIDEMRDDNLEKIVKYFSQQISEMFPKEDINQQISFYNAAMETVIKKLQELHIRSDDLQNTASSSEDEHALSREENLIHFCEKTLELILLKTSQRNHRHIQAACRFIDEALSNNQLSLADVAEHLDLSPQYVSRIFKEQIGINYNDYINEKRIEKAKELLCQPELSIKDISDQTGFGSPQHFSRTFRKYTDISPSQYRELHLKK